VAVHCYDDSTINIVVAITITIVLVAADNAEWSSAEIERFQQAVVDFDKDFLKISQHVSIP